MRIFLFLCMLASVTAKAECPDWYATWPHNGKIYSKDDAPEDSYALPKRDDGECVQLVDLSLEDGKLVEDTKKKSDRVAAEETAKQAADAAKDSRKQVFRGVENAIDNAANLAQLKAVMKAFSKAIIVELGKDQ